MKAIIKNHTTRAVVKTMVAILLCAPLTSISQCIASAPRSATNIANDNSIGQLSFTNLSGALTSDNNRATASVVISLLSGSTNYLKATGFGFNIPAYSMICGVELEIEKRANGLVGLGEWITDNQVRLVKGGVITGSNLAKAGNWTGTENYFSYGGSSSLWGTTLTPADVNSADFGIAFSASWFALAAVLPAIQIDHVRLTIHYNPILPTHILAFDADLFRNLIHLEWKTGDEEENSSVTLQRSDNGGSGWRDLYHYHIELNNAGGHYRYTDTLKFAGNYSYRLQMRGANGVITYSKIKQIVYKGSDDLFIYPNPSSGVLFVERKGENDVIRVYDMLGRMHPLPVSINSAEQYELNTSRLPKGIYYVSNGRMNSMFVKQ